MEERPFTVDADAHVLEPPDAHVSAADEIRASVAGLSERRRRLVLGENARRLFRL